MVLIFTFLLLFVAQTLGGDITSSQPCNPVKNNTEITLTAIWDMEWTLCEWYRVTGERREPICALSPRSPGDDLQCKQNSSLSGGIYSELRCNLKLSADLVTPDVTGNYLVIMSRTASGEINSSASYPFEVKVTRPSDVTLTRFNTDPEETSIEVSGGTRLEFQCGTTAGVPRADTFLWKINGGDGFLTDGSWTAVTYPVELNNGTLDGISQRLSLVAPSAVGDYELLCEAVEFDYGQLSDPANFTIRVIEEPSTRLSDEWIIVICVSVAFFLFLVIVLVCLLAFCYKCLCFRPKKDRRPYSSNNNINNNNNNSNNTRTVANERPKTVATTNEGLFTNLFSTDSLNTKRKRSSSPIKNYNESGVDVPQTYAPTIPTRQSAFSITGNGSGLPSSRSYNDYNRPTEDSRLQQQQLRQPSFNQSINSSGLHQPSRNQYNFSTGGGNIRDGSGRQSGRPGLGQQNQQFLHINAHRGGDTEAGSFV